MRFHRVAGATLTVVQDPRIRLLLQDLDRALLVAGGEQGLHELLGQRRRQLAVDGAVEQDDATEG